MVVKCSCSGGELDGSDSSPLFWSILVNSGQFLSIFVNFCQSNNKNSNKKSINQFLELLRAVCSRSNGKFSFSKIYYQATFIVANYSNVQIKFHSVKVLAQFVAKLSCLAVISRKREKKGQSWKMGTRLDRASERDPF